MKRVSLKNEKKKGFTLVELIIVIAIIAILAAIAIPKFGSMRQTANIKADIATAKNIATIVAAGVADNKIKVGQTSAAVKTLAPYSGSTNVDITESLDGGTDTAKVAESTATGGDKFNVTIGADGNITVQIGTIEIYPEVKSGKHS